MFSRATILLLSVFCFTFTVSSDVPRDKEIICDYGYRVRNETNGIREGMCTIGDTNGDHVCYNCTRKVPKGVKCVMDPGDVSIHKLRKSRHNTTCANYEKLYRDEDFIGFGCANAKKPQKARCLEIEHITTCPPNSCP